MRPTDRDLRPVLTAMQDHLTEEWRFICQLGHRCAERRVSVTELRSVDPFAIVRTIDAACTAAFRDCIEPWAEIPFRIGTRSPLRLRRRVR